MTANFPNMETVRAALLLANRAPSVHNSQPWRWRIGPHSLHLYAENSWHLEHADPDRRDLIVSCGAALNHCTVALAALAHADLMLETVDVIKAQRDRIVTGLGGLGLDPVASDANFVLFGGLADAQVTWSALLERGVLVRDVGIAHYLRVTAGTPQETTRFLEALADLAEAHRTGALP